MFRNVCLLFIFVFLWGCSTTRKISQIGLRELSSVRENLPISELRTKIISMSSFSKSCPKEIRDHFSALAGERINFPGCPQGLPEAVQASLAYLKIEERTTVEEVLNSHCRSLGITEFGDSLESLIANFDTTGPLGRRNKNGPLPANGDTKVLNDLRNGLQELVNHHLPLERWMRRNGDFVLPEEELRQLSRLVLDSECRLLDQDVDYSYHTIRSLEELSTILKEEDQEKRIEHFLGGVHLVIEQKIREYFRQ